MKLILYVNPDKINYLVRSAKDDSFLSFLSKQDISLINKNNFAQVILDSDFYYMLLDNDLI